MFLGFQAPQRIPDIFHISLFILFSVLQKTRPEPVWRKTTFPLPLPRLFFSPCYLCSKSGQVVLIISSAEQTPGCIRFLLASPKLLADIVFKAPLSQRQEQHCCTALPVDVMVLFLLKQMGFLMASVSSSMRISRNHFPTQWQGKKKQNSTGERDAIGRSTDGFFFSK